MSSGNELPLSEKLLVWVAIIGLIVGAFFFRLHFLCEESWVCMLSDRVVYVKGSAQ